jgi:16S rRNA processing protein RimM
MTITPPPGLLEELPESDDDEAPTEEPTPEHTPAE